MALDPSPSPPPAWAALCAISPDPLVVVDRATDRILAAPAEVAALGLAGFSVGATLEAAWPLTARAGTALADVRAGGAATIALPTVVIGVRARVLPDVLVLALRGEPARPDVERFHRAFDALTEGVMFIHRDGLTTYANPAAARIFRPTWDLVGTTVPARRWRVFDESGEAVTEPPAFATLRDGAPRERVVLQFHRDDDSVLWLEVSSAVVAVDAEGRPETAVALCIDVTAERAREQARRAAEDRYHSLFHNLSTAFALYELVTDEAGEVVDYRWLEVNPAFERMIGRPAAELVGRRVRELLPGTPAEWADRIAKATYVARTGKGITHEDFVARSDRWFENWVFCPAPGQFATMVTETTERRRALAAIAASETRYRTLFENLNSAFALHEIITNDAGEPIDFRWLEVNPAYERLLGMSAETIIGRRALEVLPKTEIRWLETFGHVALTGEPTQMEDYSQEFGRWFETWTYRPAPRQFAVIVTETTERRRIADQIAASEARYRALADTSVDMISRHDREGRYLYASPAAHAILGRAPEAVLGTPAMAFIAEADHVLATSALGQLIETRAPARVQYRLVHPDGALRWVETVSRSVETAGGQLEIVAFTRDISEQKRMSALVEEVDAFNSALFGTVGALVILLDRQGNTVLFNPACEQLSGWSAHEVIGKPFFDVFVPEEQRPAVRAVFERLAAGQFPNRHENEWLTRSGERRWIAWANSALLDEHGQVRYVFGTGVDRTTERRAELALHEANANLERIVADRTADLAATNRELESFSYSVSHDLRAPLRAIDGFARVIDEDFGDQLPAEARRSFGRIRAASQRLSVLIDDLLAMSRSARAELTRATVDLSAIAADIVDGLRRAEPHRTVAIQIAPGLRAVADPALARTVLENLLGNAWKYTGRRTEAHIAFAASGAPGTFDVIDDGAGFDMTYADKLFGAFQRLHGASEFPGNGIGLATTRRILARHGGGITARAEVGRGATFTFSFGDRGVVP